MMDNLADRDGEIYLLRDFYPPEQAEVLFTRLSAQLAWQEEEIVLFGKQVKVPRLMCWYGDPGAVYTYSGVSHHPLPWSEELQAIRERLLQDCRLAFNSVLGNLYRDGRDSMGWHADNEKELGRNPAIASLNLGGSRLFRIRHNKSRHTLDLMLSAGDLLLMAGSLQHHWRHCVPKTARAGRARINLTFRQILQRQSSEWWAGN